MVLVVLPFHIPPNDKSLADFDHSGPTQAISWRLHVYFVGFHYTVCKLYWCWFVHCLLLCCSAVAVSFFPPILWYNLKCCLYKLIIYLKAIFVFLSIFVRNSVVLNSNWHTKLTFHRSFFYISHWNSVHKHNSNYIIQ